MTTQEQFTELQQMCQEYVATPRAEPVKAFNWTALLAIVPVLLSLFVKNDPQFLAIIQKIVELISGLFGHQPTATTSGNP